MKMLQLQKTLPAIATLFWGGAIVWLYAAGRMGQLLEQKFYFPTLIGGFGMIVLGLFVLLTQREESDCGHDHCDHGHDHHDQNPITVLALMVLPLLLALTTDTSAGFSVDVLARKGLYDNRVDASLYELPPYTLETLQESTPQNSEGRFQLPLSQIFFSAGDQSMMDIFGQVEIETEGQVVAELDTNGGENRLRIYRTLMTCCAADAAVLAFPIEFKTRPPTFAERSWVRIGGTLRYEEFEKGHNPVFEVEKIEAIPPPTQAGFTGW